MRQPACPVPQGKLHTRCFLTTFILVHNSATHWHILAEHQWRAFLRGARARSQRTGGLGAALSASLGSHTVPGQSQQWDESTEDWFSWNP